MEDYSIDKAVEFLKKNASHKSLGMCAMYVRKALNKGGITGIYGHAFTYIDSLPTFGFENLGKIKEFKKGDIIVFPKIKSRKYGHISMYTGDAWVSDFPQKNIIVHSDYIYADYSIFRKK